MADMNLRKRLAAAAGMILDDSLLDQIHSRLIASQDKAKASVTVKYDFTTGPTGELDVKITPTTSLPLNPLSIRLSSDGSQLTLFDSDDEDEEKDPGGQIAGSGVEQEVPRQEVVTPEGLSSAQQERLAAIQAQNENLYRQGAVSRGSAKMAGVDVDAIDAEKERAPF